ncbi:hypothetical protein [Spongiimicrobium sp. 3-5]|uniref:hypothetical protein n=1 Tax=Spongiimicrobium sp. 3-5 TaxID=3332596 RepID=UPI003981412E
MAENQTTNNTSSDEIDLGQLFQMIGRGFQRVFRFILRVFLYLKKNVFVLVGLAAIGIALGVALNQIVEKRLKTEVIVKPNLETKNYLYDVVDEIQANIRAKDTSFFKGVGIEIMNFQGYEITIEAASEATDNADVENDLKYLELLQKFKNEGFVSDVVRSEILNKSSLNHRITFYYKNKKIGRDFSEKLITYINSNQYFNDLIKVNRQNAEERINQNESIVAQIDALISQYATKMAQEDNMEQGTIVLDNEEQLDITGLFNLKNALIRDIEQKRLELQEQLQPISIINFGNIQPVQKSFFGKHIILLPSILIGLFFLISILKYLNRKAKEMHV